MLFLENPLFTADRSFEVWTQDIVSHIFNNELDCLCEGGIMELWNRGPFQYTNNCRLLLQLSVLELKERTNKACCHATDCGMVMTTQRLYLHSAGRNLKQ